MTHEFELWHWFATQPRRSNSSALMAMVDVGTSKICCYIARDNGLRGFEVVGRGYQGAEGFVAGNVDDRTTALESILAAVQEAEEQAGEQLRSVSVVWRGGSCATRCVALDRPLLGRQMDAADLAEMTATAAQDEEFDDRIALRVGLVDAQFDDGKRVSDPIGVSGDNICLEMAVTSVERQQFDELLQLFQEAHLSVELVIDGASASAIAVLTQDEATRGCLVIEMGGGVTSASLWHGGRLIHSDQIDYGGDHVSRDVSIGLNTSIVQAERLKSLYGSVQRRSCDDNMWIDVPTIDAMRDGQPSEIPRSRLTMIVRERVVETLSLLQKRLNMAMPVFDRWAPCSVVLSGGAAQIEGMVELAEEHFGLPARLGRPGVARGPHGPEDQPCCSAANGGLVVSARDDGCHYWQPKRSQPAWSSGFDRVQRWIKENFAS